MSDLTIWIARDVLAPAAAAALIPLVVLAISWSFRRLLTALQDARFAPVRAAVLLAVRAAQQSLDRADRRAAVEGWIRARYPRMPADLLHQLVEASVRQVKLEEQAVQAAAPVVTIPPGGQP